MLRYCLRILRRTRARGSVACNPRQRPLRMSRLAASPFSSKSRRISFTIARSVRPSTLIGGKGFPANLSRCTAVQGVSHIGSEHAKIQFVHASADLFIGSEADSN